ncbi:DnaD domain protein, partial [Metaclostridioides mangenotii]|uniref:DnaD domain protein n=1 Tax=Metaclostridioides mangenotii TaxID=1540 RepID=UPI0026EFE00E
GLIPQMVARDKTISIGAKGLYSYLSSIAGANGTCYPSRDTITNELSISKDTFTKYLSELKKRGYIKVTQRRVGKGKMYNNIYEVIFDKKYIENLWITQPCPKKHDTVKDEDKAPCPKISDTDESIVNSQSQPCPKKHDTDETLESQQSSPCPKISSSPCPRISDSNSNSININSKYVCIDEQENKTTDNSITEFKKLYEQNIGVVYPIKAQWLIGLSQEIDIHLFKRAIEICAENEKMTNSYLNGILRKWRDKNITTYEQLKTYELGVRNKQEATEKKITKESSYKPKKTKFHNFNESFTQYSEAELDEIIRKSQREKFK